MSQTTPPRIGIFWLVQGKLLACACLLAEAESCDNLFDSPADHYSHWQKWRQQHQPELRACAYDHFPRGRIVYNAAQDNFIVYADRCLLAQKTFPRKIKHAFNLAGQQVIFKDDFHYQCHRCNPFFVSD